MDKKLPHHHVDALIQPTEPSSIPLDFGYNLNSRTIYIQQSWNSWCKYYQHLNKNCNHISNSIICHLQPVHIQKYEEEPDSDLDTSELTFCTDWLTELQINKSKELVQIILISCLRMTWTSALLLILTVKISISKDKNLQYAVELGWYQDTSELTFCTDGLTELQINKCK
jgi:hypothetical protein